MSDQKIESILTENRLFPPGDEFREQANIKSRTDYDKLRAEAEQDHEGFWAKLAHTEISWFKDFTKTLDETKAPHYSWFTDGELNVSYNCIDRHLKKNGDKIAIIFEGEKGDTRNITFKELHREVCLFANALKAKGIKKGDRVVIYMPMTPEAVIAMQGCARIGAIHSVVFGGFSAASLKDRIEDATCKAVITADGGNRGGKVIELKAACDEALAKGCASIETVFVFKRAGNDVTMNDDRDVWVHDLTAGLSEECEPEWVNAEHPLFLLYTSGSTGKPKGIQHSSGGYLINCIMTMKWVFDIKEDDIFWCTADVGWITGHSYVAYGPLATGTTTVIYEGAPTVPDAGRFWDLVERHKISIFYTAPTAIRALMKLGEDFPNSHDLSSLRLLGTVGEPINPEAWIWYHKVIGKEKCPIVDTWWQTETGAHIISPVPGAIDTKPGSCTLPLPGIAVDVVDEAGEPITEPDRGGYLVISKPWPSMLRTIWGDEQRYIDTYWGKFNNRLYVAGDSCRRDKDGYFWIMGRIDDVLNVSGHRLGTMEVESALVAHERVVESAVVGRPDDIKGEAIFAFVVIKGERPTGAEADTLVADLRKWVTREIGAIARPDNIRFTDNLPKTRSGKIMRRLLRSIARGEEITQDISTLENEEIVKQLQGTS